MFDIIVPDEGNTVTIKGGRSTTNIKGMEASEFPLIPSADGGETPINLDASLLKEMINEVAFAAADDESRPVFTGVLVQVSNEKITFAAADAFRLAVRVASLPGDTETRSDILISRQDADRTRPHPAR